MAMWCYRYIYDVMPWYRSDVMCMISYVMSCHDNIEPMSCAWYRRFTNTCFTFIIKQLSIIIIIYHKTSFSYMIRYTQQPTIYCRRRVIISSISPLEDNNIAINTEVHHIDTPIIKYRAFIVIRYHTADHYNYIRRRLININICAYLVFIAIARYDNNNK